MRLKELTWHSLPIWPPHWVEKSPKDIEHGFLKGAEILPLTDLIKIDVAYGTTIVSGLIVYNEKYRASLFCKLKENIGKPFNELSDMEILF